MIKAVIFDVDDTLVSENHFIKSGYEAVAKNLSETYQLDKQYVIKKLNDLFIISPKSVFNRFFEEEEIEYSSKDILDLIEIYRSHKPTLQPYEDVYPILKHLKELDIKTGVITDGFAVSQHNKVEALKLIDYIDNIIVTDDLGRDYWKPHPRAFEIQKDFFNTQYDEMIYVGDNPAKDFHISSVYPIHTVRIDRNGVHKSAKYLNDIKENYSITSLHEIIDIIESINKK